MVAAGHAKRGFERHASWRGRIACSAVLGAWGLALVGCAPAQEARASKAVGAVVPPAAKPKGAGAMLLLGTGNVVAGSKPGSPGRDVGLEADLVTVAQTPFEIDRLPYPNDPSREPMTGIDQGAARTACETAGKRLCSELEWERACDATEGFLGSIAEWTDSALDAPGQVGSVVRGASMDASNASNATDAKARCSRRTTTEAASTDARRGFRCCKGTAQAATYPTPTLDAPPVETLTLSAEQARVALAALSQQPEIAALAKTFTPFGDADVSAALRRGKRSRDSITALSILSAAVTWRPVPGEELHVLTGRAGQDALLVVLYALADGTHAHAASVVLREPEATFALGYRDTARSELSWTTCYGCPTEGGAIRYAQGRVTIDFR